MGVLARMIDELEDDRLEVKVVDRGGLELTTELDVIPLVRFLEDQLGKVPLGGAVLGLDLVVHFLQTNNYKSENLFFLLIYSVFLGDLEVILDFELINDLLHVLGQEEREEWSELILSDLKRLDEDLGEEDDTLTTEEQGVQSFVLSALVMLFVAVPFLRIMGGAVEVTSLLSQRAGDLEGLGTVVLPLELVLIGHH